MKHTRNAVLILVIAATFGCQPHDTTTLLSVEPPKDWVAQLETARGQRDHYFRTSPESPLMTTAIPEFKGLEYYEPTPGFYFVGPIEYYTEPEPMEMITTSGKQRDCEKIGRVRFEIDGTPTALQVYRLLDIQDPTAALFLPFNDATTGTETYPAGRYVDLVGPQGGPYVLDFNRSYNPSCAYGAPERFACPVTPAENRLEVRIAAGERGYHEAEATAGE